MNKFLIFGNKSRDENLVNSKKAKEYLEKINKKAIIYTEDIKDTDFDIIVVIGGDGTILTASWKFRDIDAPILGINLGTLGYLAEVSKDELEVALKAIVDGRYLIEERMLLRGLLVKKDEEEIEMFGLNDVVLFKDNSLNLIRYNVIVNNKLLYTYNADGVIISTPTGSTSYSLACGGPIIEPTAECILITPIAAHSLNSRSIVLSPNDVIKLQVVKVRKDVVSKATVVCDGVEIGNLSLEDEVVIQKSKKRTKLIKLEDRSFMEILRQKMSV